VLHVDDDEVEAGATGGFAEFRAFGLNPGADDRRAARLLGEQRIYSPHPFLHRSRQMQRCFKLTLQ